LSDSLDELFCVIAQVDRHAGRFPTVFALADGFLVVLPGPTKEVIPGTLRLRRLGEHIYLPIDADLSPPLLADEARGLTRDRGLVFLANGRTLSYLPSAPLAPAQMVTAGEVHRRPWRRLPAPPPRIDRIASIIIDLPQEGPDTILERQVSDIGTEQPRPASSSLPAKIVGTTLLAAGKVMLSLGQLPGLRQLAKIGASWIDRALAWSPRLSESLMDKQEAALRELLRWFRAGDLEEALRRALPLGDSADRGGVAAGDSILPTHNLLYSLSNLLGVQGTASTWFGGGNVQIELSREYRKAAQQATARGDYRRAAFIYGKLLRDYRSAANVLSQGGLFHDAAILFLKKLEDRLAAARAFDAGGEFDLAVQLLRQLGEHLAAGDLLRRIGEKELALFEYERAVAKVLEQHDYLTAAQIMLTHANLPERAREYLRAGWQRRPAPNSAPCASFLARLFLEQGDTASLLSLVVEARAFFASAGQDQSAVEFFRSVASMADQPAAQPVRDDVRDHALIGLADLLRQRARVESKPGNIVSTYFGAGGPWAAPVVADGQFAFHALLEQQKIGRQQPMRRKPITIRLGTGRLTAACQAPRTGMIFAGFLSGDVVGFRPASGEVVRIKSGDGLQVTSLATDVDGRFVLVLQAPVYEKPEALLQLVSYESLPEGDYRFLARNGIVHSGQSWLLPLLVDANAQFALCDSDKTQYMSVYLPPSITFDEPHFLAISCPVPYADRVTVHVCQRSAWCASGNFYETNTTKVPLTWIPRLPTDAESPLAPISWLQYGTHLEIAAPHDEGALYWSKLCLDQEGLRLVSTAASTVADTYRAAAIIQPGVVAGVRSGHIDWLRFDGRHLQLHSSMPLAPQPIISSFTSHLTRELLVISSTGLLDRVPLPQGI
jgi:tetratricopeptide (TPR) repeat protein